MSTSPEDRLNLVIAALKKQRSLLEILEWSWDGACPSCLNEHDIDHESDCELKQGMNSIDVILKSSQDSEKKI